jgi:hypothetical protein
MYIYIHEVWKDSLIMYIYMYIYTGLISLVTGGGVQVAMATHCPLR